VQERETRSRRFRFGKPAFRIGSAEGPPHRSETATPHELHEATQRLVRRVLERPRAAHAA
jgi:hypothetical protein